MLLPVKAIISKKNRGRRHFHDAKFVLSSWLKTNSKHTKNIEPFIDHWVENIYNNGEKNNITWREEIILNHYYDRNSPK
jgi:hypothetical protein